MLLYHINFRLFKLLSFTLGNETFSWRLRSFTLKLKLKTAAKTAMKKVVELLSILAWPFSKSANLSYKKTYWKLFSYFLIFICINEKKWKKSFVKNIFPLFWSSYIKCNYWLHLKWYQPMRRRVVFYNPREQQNGDCLWICFEASYNHVLLFTWINV